MRYWPKNDCELLKIIYLTVNYINNTENETIAIEMQSPKITENMLNGGTTGEGILIFYIIVYIVLWFQNILFKILIYPGGISPITLTFQLPLKSKK